MKDDGERDFFGLFFFGMRVLLLSSGVLDLGLAFGWCKA